MSATIQMKKLTCSCGHAVRLAPVVHLELSTSGQPLECPRCGHQAKVRPLAPIEIVRYQQWVVSSIAAHREAEAEKKRLRLLKHVPSEEQISRKLAQRTWKERLQDWGIGLLFWIIAIKLAVVSLVVFFVHPFLSLLGIWALFALCNWREGSRRIPRRA